MAPIAPYLPPNPLRPRAFGGKGAEGMKKGFPISNWERYYKAEDGATEIDQPRRHNRSNQIVAIDGTNVGVAYDKNGNMLRVPTGDGLEGPPRHLKWNAWNQMVEVRDDGDALIQRNVYDALFRRTTREMADATVIHCYYNDQWRPVEERIGSSTNPSAVYYWGARHRDDLARRDRDTNGDGALEELLWCLMDYFDPVVVIGGDGAIVERYAFTAFGVASILAPDYAPRVASVVAWDFLFHGQFEDGETGWQNYGFRFYAPKLGCWPNTDLIAEAGGKNMYLFCENNCVDELDLLGLIPVHFTLVAPESVPVTWSTEVPVDKQGEAILDVDISCACWCEPETKIYKVECTVVTTGTIRLNPNAIPVGKGSNGRLLGPLRQIGYEQLYGHEQRHIQSRNQRVKESANDNIDKRDADYLDERPCNEAARAEADRMRPILVSAAKGGSNHKGGNASNELSPISEVGYPPLEGSPPLPPRPSRTLPGMSL
jgi:RHS repeat-associated protein